MGRLPRQTPPPPPPQADTPWADTPWAGTPRDSHCIRQYASYWDAFLSDVSSSKLSRGVCLGEGVCVHLPRPRGRQLPPPPTPVNRMTDRCQKHYLSATSFAGSNNYVEANYTVTPVHNWFATRLEMLFDAWCRPVVFRNVAMPLLSDVAEKL